MTNLLLKVRLTAVAMLLSTGPAMAQAVAFPSACPSMSGLVPTVRNDAPTPTGQVAALRRVGEAQAAMRQASRENVAKAISLAEQVVQSDPDNPAPHLVLARAHAASQRYLDVPRSTAQSRSWGSLSKARALAPANVEGLQLFADQVIARNQDYTCAKSILETALRLEPQNALNHHYYSQLLSGMGKFDEAFSHADQALVLANADTRDMITINAGRPRYMGGQYGWVLAHYAKYLESHPGHSLSHFYRSLAFGAKGMFEEALTEAKRAMPAAPSGDAGGIGMLALAYANAGQRDQAREMLDELLQRDTRGEHVVEYRIAAVYEVLGMREEAFRWLNKDIDDRDGLGSWLVWLNHDPVWTQARSDPRFAAIRKRAGW